MDEILFKPFERSYTSQAILKLPPRKRQISVLVARGFSNKEIAEELGISHKTVKNTVSSLLSIFGVKTRTQLAAMVADYSARQEQSS